MSRTFYFTAHTVRAATHRCLFFFFFSLRYPDTTDTAAAINQLGCKHVSKSVGESHVDEKNKLVTTCAFMCNAPIHEIFDGIGAMVQDVLKLA